MIVKQSTAALRSTSHALPNPGSLHFWTASRCRPRALPCLARTAYSNRIQGLRCQYATVSNDHGRSSDNSSEDLPWPSSRNPTPYEIFNQKRGEKYSKARFYMLVKLYHPDRHHLTRGVAISPARRLERYRLVIAANAILCDPEKRRAYDLFGSGWGEHVDIVAKYRAADKSWRDMPGNASRNATWEDWERWYAERDGKKPKQTPLYMSNELFVVLLCAVVVIGSMGQARRANSQTMNLIEMRDHQHEAISQDIRRKRDDLAVLSRHERVENFLRQRDQSWNLDSQADTPDFDNRE